MQRLADLPKGAIFRVSGAPEKGEWRKVTNSQKAPVVAARGRSGWRHVVSPDLLVEVCKCGTKD